MTDFRLDWNDKELKAKVQAVCKKACLNGARDVAIDAKMNAPVDTGKLVFSIEVKSFVKSDAVGAYVKAGGDDRGHIARFVELGTPGTVYKKGSKNGSKRAPIVANPYLRPALKKKKSKILAGIKDKLK